MTMLRTFAISALLAAVLLTACSEAAIETPVPEPVVEAPQPAIHDILEAIYQGQSGRVIFDS